MPEITIRFSRHARRRMKLYGIDESSIEDILQSQSFAAGKQKLVMQVKFHTLPTKIIFDKSANKIVVISVYPVKKGLK